MIPARTTPATLSGARLLTGLLSGALLLAALPGCCCFGMELPDPDANPPPGDAAPVEAARAYARENAAVLTGALDGGGGPGGCAAGVAALALDVAVAVVSRGHAGGSMAAQVSFDPAACVARIVVLVVWSDHAWRAIGAQALDAGGAVIGAVGGADDGSGAGFVASPPAGDVDVEVDELFD